MLVVVSGGIGIALGTTPPPAAPAAAPTASPTPTESTAPSTPTPAPSDSELAPDEAAAAQEAEQSLVSLVQLGNEVGADPTASLDGIEELASGFVLGEIQALAAERAQLGYTQTGEAKVTSVTVDDVDLGGRPPSLTLDVCVDVSDIDVLDADGTSLSANMYLPDTPVHHRYGAQQLDGRWKLVSHDLPDAPGACS